MIARLAYRLGPSLAVSIMILAAQVLLSSRDGATWVEAGSLLAMGLVLNMLCRRFKIIGRRSHMVLLVFSMLSGLLFPVLDIRALVSGSMWLVAVYLAFDSWEDQERGRTNLIYIGVLLGVSQLLYHHAVYFFLPFFILFYQNAILNLRDYLLSLLYFVMVLAAAVAFSVAMGVEDGLMRLIPSFEMDYSEMLIPQFRVMFPVLAVTILVHLMVLGTYRFRYPNRSILINRSFFYQFALGLLLVGLSASAGMLVLVVLPVSILLSVAFSFTEGKALPQALFLALLCSILALAYFFL